jgi:hypothetical protein
MARIKGVPSAQAGLSRWLIHTETWEGPGAWWTTLASSPRAECRSTASLRRAANAAMVWSAP